MYTIIDSYYNQHKKLSDYLLDKNENSMKSEADSRFAKVLVLASASYFEKRILDCISEYCETVIEDDDKIMNLLKIKVFTRQYHTLFDWNGINANKFFSHFGDEIIEKHKYDVKKNSSLKNSEKDFISIGNQRNNLIHSNFVAETIDDTYNDVYRKFENALEFVKYIESIFKINVE